MGYVLPRESGHLLVGAGTRYKTSQNPTPKSDHDEEPWNRYMGYTRQGSQFSFSDTDCSRSLFNTGVGSGPGHIIIINELTTTGLKRQDF
jgi:hypothetical protein